MTSDLWKSVLLGWLTTVLAGGVPACLLVGGCATGANEPERQATFDRSLQMLREAEFRGQVTLKSAGSPFGFTQSSTFAFGPQQMSFEADGSVNFAPKTANMTIEDASAIMRRLDEIETKVSVATP